MTTPAMDFEELARVQRIRSGLLTQLDTWQTAAWMTCLLPFGLFFGVPALLMLRSKRAAVQNGQLASDGQLASVGRALSVARGFVLGGAACAALVFLATLFHFTTELDAFAVAVTRASINR